MLIIFLISVLAVISTLIILSAGDHPVKKEKPFIVRKERDDNE